MSTYLFGAMVGGGSLVIFRSSLGRLPTSTIRFRVEQGLLSKHRQNLAIVGSDSSAFVARFFLTGVVALVAYFLAVGALLALGVGLPMPVAFLGGVVVPATAFVAVSGRLETQARQSRMSFTYALSSYLDLVNVLLAGGAGSETALYAAAATGDNWAFGLLRTALDTSRAERVPPWDAFADLGRLIGVVDLERIAGSMQLAGEQGAKVRVSLAAQADALRSRQVSEIEAAAQAATERMGVPTVLLFAGFISLLGYPALDLVIGNM